jgi:hypothetical protein
MLRPKKQRGAFGSALREEIERLNYGAVRTMKSPRRFLSQAAAL